MVKKNAAVAGERKTPCVKPQSYNTRWTLGKANNNRKLKVVNQSSPNKEWKEKSKPNNDESGG